MLYQVGQAWGGREDVGELVHQLPQLLALVGLLGDNRKGGKRWGRLHPFFQQVNMV